MAGFRFRLNQRLSISAETSLSFILESSHVSGFLAASFPAASDQQGAELPHFKTNPKISSMYTSFAQPLSIFLTFDI